MISDNEENVNESSKFDKVAASNIQFNCQLDIFLEVVICLALISLLNIINRKIKL